MNNARTRRQGQARLKSTESLTSSERGGKGEAELRAQVPTAVSERTKPLTTRKRRLGAALEEEQGRPAAGAAAIQNDVQDGTRGKSSSVRDRGSAADLTSDSRQAAMGSSSPRLTTHQRDSRRGTSGALERVRESGIDRRSKKNIDHGISGREAEVFYEEKKGKRKVLGHGVRKSGKGKDGDAVSDRNRAAVFDNPISQYLSFKKRRQDVLDVTVIEDIDNLTGRFTRGALTKGVAKPGTDCETGKVHMKKRKQVRLKGEADDAPIVAEGESAPPEVLLTPDGGSAKAQVPLIPEEGTAKVRHVDVRPNDSKLASSNQTAELGRELTTKSTAPLESPADVTGLSDVPPVEGPKLSRIIKTRKEGESLTQVHVVKESRGALLKKSARITRGMRKTGLDPTGRPEATSPALGKDLECGSTIDEPSDQVAAPMAIDQTAAPMAVDQTVALMTVDQTAAPMTADQTAAPMTVDQTAAPMTADQLAVSKTAAETVSMQLRNHKEVGGAANLNAPERPRKRFKKKQDKPPADAFQSDVGKSKDIDAALENRIASGIVGLGASDASTSHGPVNPTETSHSHVNPTETEMNGKSSRDREEHNGSGTQPLLTEGVLTRSRKIDGASGNEPQIGTGLLPVVLGHSVKPIKGKGKNDPQIGPGLLPVVSGHAVKPIKGKGKKANDEKDISRTIKERTDDGTRRKEDGLGSLKKRGKKKIDPGGLLNSEGHLEKGGAESVLDKKASAPGRNGLQDEGTRQYQGEVGSGEFVSGPSSEIRTELDDQRPSVQNVEAVTAEETGKAQKTPVKLAGTTDKTGAVKSVQLAETSGGCQLRDQHASSPKSVGGETGEMLKALVPRERPTQIVGVLTRGRKVDGRKGTGSAKGPTKTKVWRRVSLGRPQKGQGKGVGLGALLKNSKSRVDNRGVDSAQKKASEPGSSPPQGEQTHQCTLDEESDHLGLGPSSEVQTGLGEEDAVHVQGVGAEADSARLEQASALHNVGSEGKTGAEKPVNVAEIDHHDQVLSELPDEREDDRLKKPRITIPRKLPVRGTVYHTRGRKVDEARAESEMEPGLQPVVSEQSDHCRQADESDHLGLGPSSEVQTGLGEKDAVHVQGVGAEADSARLEQASALHNVGSEVNTGAEKPVNVADRDGRDAEIDHHDQVLSELPDEREDDRLKKPQIKIPRKLPMRATVYHTRARKVDDEARTESEMEHGLQPVVSEQSDHCRQAEESDHLGLGPSSEVQTGLGEKDAVHMQGIGAKADSARLEQPAALHNVGSEGKTGAEKPVNVADRNGRDAEIDHHDQVLSELPDEREDDRLRKPQITIPRKLHVRATVYHNRASKVDDEARTESEMEHGLQPVVSEQSNQLIQARGKTKQDAGKGNGSSSEYVQEGQRRSHLGRPKRGGGKVVGIRGLPKRLAGPIESGVGPVPENATSNLGPSGRPDEDTHERIPAEASPQGRQRRSHLGRFKRGGGKVVGIRGLPKRLAGPIENGVGPVPENATSNLGPSGRPDEDTHERIPAEASPQGGQRRNHLGRFKRGGGKVVGIRGLPKRLAGPIENGVGPVPENATSNLGPSGRPDEDTHERIPAEASPQGGQRRNHLGRFKRGGGKVVGIRGLPKRLAGPIENGVGPVPENATSNLGPSGRPDEDTHERIPAEASPPVLPEPKKIQMELREQRIEGETAEAAGTEEKRTESQREGSGEEKGIELPAEPVVEERGCQENDHHDQAVETQDVGKGKSYDKVNSQDSRLNPAKKAGANFLRSRGEVVPVKGNNLLTVRKGFLRALKGVVSVKDTSLLRPSKRSTNVEMEKVSEASVKSMGMPGKKKRKKLGIGTQNIPEVANNVSPPPSVSVTIESPELADEPSANRKGRSGRKTIPKTGIAADLQPPVEGTDEGVAVEERDTPSLEPPSGKGRKGRKTAIVTDLQPLLQNVECEFRIEDVDLPQEPNQGRPSRGDHKGQEELYEELPPVPKQRKGGRPRTVTPASVNTEERSEVIPEVGHSMHVIENPPSSSVVEKVDAGVVQSEGFVGRVGLLGEVDESARKESWVKVPVDAGDLDRASDDHESQQKLLVEVLPPDGATSEDIPEKVDVKSPVDGVAPDTLQSEHAEGPPEPLVVAVEVTQNASQVGADLTLQSSGAQDGIASGQVSPKRIKKRKRKDYKLGLDFQRVTRGGPPEPLVVAVDVTQNTSQVGADLTLQSSGAQDGIASGQVLRKRIKKWRRKDYKLGLDFQRVTRGKLVANIEHKGDNNGTAAPEALTGEHAEIRVEGIMSTAQNDGVSAHLGETDVEKDELELREKSPDVPKSPDKWLVASVNVEPRNDLDESLDQNRGEPTRSAAKGREELVESCQASYFAEEDVAVMAVALEKNAAVMKVQTSLAPESPGRGVCALQEVGSAELPTSDSSLALDHLEETEMPVLQGKFNSQQHDQPAPSMESLLSDQQKNSALSKHPDSPDGPFALEDGRSLKSHCEQETASSPIDAGLNSDPAAFVVEFGASASTVDADPIASLAESDTAALIVEAVPGATASEADPITIAETSTADTPNLITSRHILESVPPVGDPEYVTLVTDSDSVSTLDKSVCVSIRDEEVSVAIVEDASAPLAVVNAENAPEICETDSVRESTVSSCKDERGNGESLIAEAVNIQQEEVALKVPIEKGLALEDDNSTESPLLQLAPAEQSVDPITLNGDESGVTLESVGTQEGQPTIQTPGVEVAQAHSLQYTGTSDAAVDTRLGSDDRTTFKGTGQSAPPSLETICRQLLGAKANDCAEPCAAEFSGLQEKLQHEDGEQNLQGEAAGYVQQRQPSSVEDSVGQPVSDAEDSYLDASVSLEPGKSTERRECEGPVPSQLRLTDQMCTAENVPEICEIDSVRESTITSCKDERGNGESLIAEAVNSQQEEVAPEVPIEEGFRLEDDDSTESHLLQLAPAEQSVEPITVNGDESGVTLVNVGMQEGKPTIRTPGVEVAQAHAFQYSGTSDATVDTRLGSDDRTTLKGTGQSAPSSLETICWQLLGAKANDCAEPCAAELSGLQEKLQHEDGEQNLQGEAAGCVEQRLPAPVEDSVGQPVSDAEDSFPDASVPLEPGNSTERRQCEERVPPQLRLTDQMCTAENAPEICNIDSVRESTVSSTKDESGNGESLIAEAVNSQQEEVAPEVPIEEGFGLEDDNSTESPLLQLAPAEQSVERITLNGDVSGVTLESVGTQEGQPTIQTPGVDVAQAHSLEYSGTSAATVDTRLGSDYRTTSNGTGQSAPPSLETICRQLLGAKENDCAEPCAAPFSGLQEELQHEDGEQNLQGEAAGYVQQRRPASVEDSVGQPVSEAEDCFPGATVPSEPGKSTERRECEEPVSPQLRLTDQMCTAENAPEICGIDSVRELTVSSCKDERGNGESLVAEAVNSQQEEVAPEVPIEEGFALEDDDSTESPLLQLAPAEQSVEPITVNGDESGVTLENFGTQEGQPTIQTPGVDVAQAHSLEYSGTSAATVDTRLGSDYRTTSNGTGQSAPPSLETICRQLLGAKENDCAEPCAAAFSGLQEELQHEDGEQNLQGEAAGYVQQRRPASVEDSVGQPVSEAEDSFPGATVPSEPGKSTERRECEEPVSPQLRLTDQMCTAENAPEICGIDSVRELTVSSCKDERGNGESLVAEAVNSQQEEVAPEVPIEEGFALEDDDSTESPLLQLAPAEQSVEPITVNGDESGVTLENFGTQEGQPTIHTPGVEVAQAHSLQYSGTSDATVDTRLGSDDRTTFKGTGQSAPPSLETICRELLGAKENDCAEPCAAAFSGLQEKLQHEDGEQNPQGEAAGCVQQRQPTSVEDSVGQPVSDAEDSFPDARVPLEPGKSTERREFEERVPPQLRLTDEMCALEPQDFLGLEQSEEAEIPQEGSGGALEDHLEVSSPMGTEQVVASCSPDSSAVANSLKQVYDDSPISSVEYVVVNMDLHQRKLSSGLENLPPLPAVQDSDDPILKAYDLEFDPILKAYDLEFDEENTGVPNIRSKADGFHTEAADFHSEAKHVESRAEETVADVEGVDAEKEDANVNVEDVSQDVSVADEVLAEVQAVEAESHQVQLEVRETQVEVEGQDDAHDSPNRDTEFVNEDTDGEKSDSGAEEVLVGAEEVHFELEKPSEVHDVDSEDDVDAAVQDPVADEVTNTNALDEERVAGLENLETTTTSQEPSSSYDLVPSCDNSVAEEDLAISVPEEDISRPVDSQAEAVHELTHTDSVPLVTENHFELAEEVPQDAGPSSQLTSPVEVGRFLEGDVLQPEELSEIQMESQETEEPKNQPLRPEDPISQRNTVKAYGVSKKRKGRFGSEATKDVVGHDGADRDEDTPATRVLSQKKGFLLASTSIESGGMRIRPRPLDPDQSMPIFVEGRDKDFYEYDGGSFYRWVQQQEEARLKRSVVDPAAADGVGEGVSKTYLVKRRSIFIPLFRKVPDDPEANSRIVRRPDLTSFTRPEAYLRHTKSAARTLGHALGCSFSSVPSMYDMDDEDEEWLQGYNESREQSGQDPVLSDDTFEELMELFEREFYRISQINNNSSLLPRNLGDKGGASGHRGKRPEAESSQRQSRLEANSEGGARLSKSVGLFEGASSQREIDRRFALQNGSEDCCICNGGENSDGNPVRRCQICSINVHQSCYGICGTQENGFGHQSGSSKWSCRKCEAVVAGGHLPSISCAICCKSGGAMKPTTDPLKWAHVACALYTNETFFVDAEAMEPVDGLAAVEARVKKQRERCGLCGAREGSCVRCSTRGCRAPFHISCGVSQGASFELRHTKQLVVGVRSFCPRHASLVPGAGDPVELLPSVSTESSDTLEMRHVEQRNIGEKGNGAEDVITNEARLDRSESRRLLKRKRSGARPRVTVVGGATPKNLDSSSRAQDLSEKDVHGVSRTLPRSGSMLKENMQGVSQYLDETDLYLHAAAEERPESEAVSAATSGSSCHLAVVFENVGHAGKEVAGNGDEVDPGNLVAKGKGVAGDADTSSQADKAGSDVVALKLPSLETVATNLAAPQTVKAVYCFWQSKRLKVDRPLLHELRQLQASKSQGIFNKVVHRSSEFLSSIGFESPARMPVTRRPRSLGIRDPVASRFSELRQHLEMLRSIAGNVVRREQLKLDDQKLLYESAQQRLLIARDAPKGRRCFWCENAQNLLKCTTCPKGFCFQCFKHRRGYGVKGWIAASKQSKYVCNFCLGSASQEKTSSELGANLLPTTFSEPRGTPVSRVALVPGRPGDWNHGLEVRTKPNSGKQVSFLNEATWIGDPPSNPYGSSSSTQAVAPVLSPGRGKTMNGGQLADAQAAYTESTVPSTTTERSGAVNRAYQDGVLSSGPNDAEGEERRVRPADGEGKKVKRRRASVLMKHPETVLRATKRIKKLARSSSFVYGSEDEAVSESDESRTDKKTVKLSDLRDKGAKKSQRAKVSEAAGAEGNSNNNNNNNSTAENGHPPLKFGIKFSSGKLILRRRGPTEHP